MESFVLNTILFLPLIVALVLALPISDKDARYFSIGAMGINVLLSLVLASQFSIHAPSLQFPTHISWVSNPIQISYSIGVDGLSMALVLLTTIVTFLAVL